MYDIYPALSQIQYSLSQKIVRKDDFNDLVKVAGADVSFAVDNNAVAAAVIWDLEHEKIIEKRTVPVKLSFPYIPTFLGIREAEPIISVLKTLKSNFDVVIVNGHGIMHPRGFGLASHVGFILDIPTMGLAKRLIGGRYINQSNYIDHPNAQVKLIEYNKRIVGAFFRGRYVSIGHKISLDTALDVISKTSIYHTPEPLRQAHLLATKTFKCDVYEN